MNEPPLPRYLSTADSSTVVVRGISALLTNQDFDPFRVTPMMKFGALIVNRLPKPARKFIMEYFSSELGVNFNLAPMIKSDELTSWVVSEYPERKYDSIILGAPSGGVGHLASYLNAPFLTQHFLMGFKGRFPIDRSDLYLEGCLDAAKTITSNNPDLQAIIHYDPVHDRFIVKRTGFVRVKLLHLTDAYKKFITSFLNPGGTVILVGCDYPWLQYEIENRIMFQIGGLGGITPEEYYKGSSRIDKYIHEERHGTERSEPGISHKNWLLDDFNLVECPESEWGLLESFARDVRDFSISNDFDLMEINLSHPDELSEIMFRAFDNLIKSEHPDMPRKIFMDSFTNSSPIFNRKVSACPLWLPFICDDSREFAIRILDFEPDETEILLALHPSFADPFDLTPLDTWREYLSRFQKLTLIGVDERTYPADLTSYFRFTSDAKKYSESNPYPLKSIGTPSRLKSLIENVSERSRA